MDCPKCKTPNPDDAPFCNLCYESLVQKKTSPPLTAFPSVRFVVKDIERIEGRGGDMIGNAMGGIVGDLVGQAINSAVDGMTTGPRERPSMFVYKPVGGIVQELQPVLADAPDIPACKEFFSSARFEVGGLSDRVKVSAVLRLRGYPLQ